MASWWSLEQAVGQLHDALEEMKWAGLGWVQDAAAETAFSGPKLPWE